MRQKEGAPRGPPGARAIWSIREQPVPRPPAKKGGNSQPSMKIRMNPNPSLLPAIRPHAECVSRRRLCRSMSAQLREKHQRRDTPAATAPATPGRVPGAFDRNVKSMSSERKCSKRRRSASSQPRSASSSSISSLSLVAGVHEVGLDRTGEPPVGGDEGAVPRVPDEFEPVEGGLRRVGRTADDHTVLEVAGREYARLVGAIAHRIEELLKTCCPARHAFSLRSR